jgi:hypothetical protein
MLNFFKTTRMNVLFSLSKGDMKVNFHFTLPKSKKNINGNLCGNFASSSSSPILEAEKCTQRSFMTVNFISPRKWKNYMHTKCVKYIMNQCLVLICRIEAARSAHTIFSGHKSMLCFLILSNSERQRVNTKWTPSNKYLWAKHISIALAHVFYYADECAVNLHRLEPCHAHKVL